MEDDELIADLIGGEAPKPRRGRPPQAETVERQNNAAKVLEQLTATRRERLDGEGTKPSNVEVINIADVQHGVTVGWLAQVFGMDPTTVKKRLRDCPPIYRRKAGYVYDLKLAAQYLVKPVFDAKEYLRNMKPSELPTHLQEAFWSAQRKRQQWEEAAGQLWRTEDVMSVLGETFQTIKFTMQLWPDNVEQALGLTPEQRTMLVGMADELQNEMHKRLVQMPKRRHTPPSSAEVLLTEEAPAEEFDVSSLV